MPVRRSKDGRWRYRHVVKLVNGDSVRISGSAPRHNNTKSAAEEEMLIHIDRIRNPHRYKKQRKEVPTLSEWFHGRFWREWVVARKNKPSEQASKKRVFKNYIEPYLGDFHIDEIGVAKVAQFRAHLVESKLMKGDKTRTLSDKYINNILAVLSKALKYAADVEMIVKAPKVGMLRVERPQITAPDFYEYARLIEAGNAIGYPWSVAVTLCGEAGLRIGEVKALRWREDVDLVAGTITVNQQMLYGKTGTPKGRTRRTIVMTETLERTLRSLDHIREGYVCRNGDGTPLRDGQALHGIKRACRKAKLPIQGWHWLRHGFGTHAAMMGVNPWVLMEWMGHKRIDETMRYVQLAHVGRRRLPEEIIAAGNTTTDPDERILKMLSARASLKRRGKSVAKSSLTKKFASRSAS